MIQCKTIAEALKVPNVMHIESGRARVIAYQIGDVLPAHCKVPVIAVERTLSERDAEVEIEAAVKRPALWKRILDWVKS